MDLGIAGHVAIVQGASKGIGRGIAEALAAEGVNLVLTARQPGPLAEAAHAITKRHGVRTLAHAMDTADLAEIPALVGRVRSQFGRLDILVCNSGGPPPGGALELTPEQWRAATDLLLVSPLALLKESMPLLRQSPAARFIVVTSSSTREPVLGLTISNTLRPGIVGLIKTLASELAADRVRCHSLAPGRIDTDRLATVIDNQAKRLGKEPAAVREGMLGAIPAGRIGSPDDMGSLAAFLCSPKADYMTGANWLVDGGLIKSI